MSNPIRILLVDDSETMLALLQELVARTPDFVLAGVARNGAQAIEMARRQHPDIITMDLLMPQMDGLAAIRQLKEQRVVVLTTLSAASISFKALEAGALEVLQKPTAYHTAQGQEAFQSVLQRLRELARLPLGEPSLRPAPAPRAVRQEQRWQGVAMAASTGGPPALKEVLQALPEDFPLPILLVQHMSQGFVAAFVDWLNNLVPPQVVLAREGVAPLPGHIYVAPDCCHLVLTPGGRLSLSDAPPVHSLRPSADLLFQSAGRAWRSEALGVILTGMGRDGTAGLRVLKEQGGTCLAQNQESCQVFGMPAAAIEAGLADQVLSLEGIAAFLTGLVRQ